MSNATLTDIERIRAEAAAKEREAILEMIEKSLRQLSHGHGANGAQVLQLLVEEVRSRG